MTIHLVLKKFHPPKLLGSIRHFKSRKDGKYCVGIYANKNLKEDIRFKKNPTKFFKQKQNFTISL